MAEQQIIGFMVIGILTFLLILKSVIIVREQTAYIIERLGKFSHIAMPGFGLIIPFIDRKASVQNLRVQQLSC